MYTIAKPTVLHRNQCCSPLLAHSMKNHFSGLQCGQTSRLLTSWEKYLVTYSYEACSAYTHESTYASNPRNRWAQPRVGDRIVLQYFAAYVLAWSQFRTGSKHNTLMLDALYTVRYKL